jgi:DNA repair protein RecO (recombination protein O)
MLIKTRGIALNYIKYQESSIISRIYTEKYGVKSYIVNGIRSKRSKKSIGFFQPLTLLDLVVYQKAGNTISRISEFKMTQTYDSIPFDIKKSAIALFLTEFILATVKEEEDHQNQFSFVFNALQILDSLKDNFNDFHLIFLIKMSRYLGFGINDKRHLSRYDMRFTISPSHANYFEEIIKANFQNGLKISNLIRKETLEILLLHYQSNFENWHDLKSLKVLNEVFY